MGRAVGPQSVRDIRHNAALGEPEASPNAKQVPYFRATPPVTYNY